MRQMWIVWTAVLLAGCAGAKERGGAPARAVENRGATSTRVVARKSFADQPDLVKDVPVGVRMVDLTWEGLVAQAKPDLVLRPAGYEDGRDMMWVEKGGKGELVLRLDRAFVWKPANAPAQWLLLMQPMGDYRAIDLAVELINTPITVTAKRPQDDHFPNYAVPLATDRAAGTVYEIGWTAWDDRGSGHYTDQRILYVWQHGDGRWQFIGEGEGSGSSHSGGERAGTWVKSSAAFVGIPGVPRIAFEVHDVTAENGPDQCGLASITEQRDYILTPAADGAAGVPALVGKKLYTEAIEGDTLETVAQRVAMRDFSSGLVKLNPRWHLAGEGALTDAQLAENAALQGKARAMLERMNSGITGRAIKAEEKVLVSREMGG
jgi:hypothetical protein